ncbi:hypothetical protein L3X38_036335 [Prunus dulcis]|uniref:Uncharacterized protein n=1 Tax=Prunus dulcis TaxID=3755 RepID=A0AAD4YQ96_PRUDU|nr:hypothetical protein L3X38_036335 [Prunus dulcis]
MNRYQSSILTELYVYFTLREAFEWAELQLLQFEGGRSGCSRGFDELGIALRALFRLSRTLHEFAEVSTTAREVQDPYRGEENGGWMREIGGLEVSVSFRRFFEISGQHRPCRWRGRVGKGGGLDGGSIATGPLAGGALRRG